MSKLMNTLRAAELLDVTPAGLRVWQSLDVGPEMEITSLNGKVRYHYDEDAIVLWMALNADWCKRRLQESTLPKHVRARIKRAVEMRKEMLKAHRLFKQRAHWARF